MVYEKEDGHHQLVNHTQRDCGSFIGMSTCGRQGKTTRTPSGDVWATSLS